MSVSIGLTRTFTNSGPVGVLAAENLWALLYNAQATRASTQR
jgi:hypothetical protein